MGELYTDGFEIVYASSKMDLWDLIIDRYGEEADWQDVQYQPLDYGEIIQLEAGPIFREHLIEAIEAKLDVDVAFIADAEYGDFYRFVEDGLKLLELA